MSLKEVEEKLNEIIDILQKDEELLLRQDVIKLKRVIVNQYLKNE